MNDSFKVSGLGPFPISMLRHDCCWPDTDVDASAIERSFIPGMGRWTVTLRTANPRVYPTHGRWDSFNVRVLD